MTNKLTKEQENRIMSLIRNTWSVISADYPGGTREEIVECVLDADYTRVYGRDKEADKWLKDGDLTMEEQDDLAMRALFRRFR